MVHPLSRRYLLVAAVPAVLAGCFEEPDDAAAIEGEQDGGETNGDVDDADDNVDSSDDSDDSADGGGSDDSDDPDETGTGEPPDRVDPDDAGIVVTDVNITDVDHGYPATVSVVVTVENVDRFVYGLIEFRVDAYTTTPNDPERESIGFEYVTRQFPTGDRFDEGTRRFRVDIPFESRDASLRADSDWYEADAAVRRAEPSDVDE